MSEVQGSNGAQPIQGPGHGRVGFTNPVVVLCSSWHIGRVHRLLDGSLLPVRIILSLKLTWHLSSLKTTVQPALHNTHIPRSDAIFMLGTMCPTSVNGKPGISMLHMCIDVTLFYQEASCL
jgi:hypothetical protein